MYTVFDQAVQKSLCTSALDALYIVWITHFLTAASLFIALIVLSHFYDIYDAFDPLDPSDCLDEKPAVDVEGDVAMVDVVAAEDVQLSKVIVDDGYWQFDQGYYVE